jgi:hypothetical protein
MDILYTVKKGAPISSLVVAPVAGDRVRGRADPASRPAVLPASSSITSSGEGDHLNARQSGHVGPAAHRAAVSDTARIGFQPDVSRGLLWISFQGEPAPGDPGRLPGLVRPSGECK